MKIASVSLDGYESKISCRCACSGGHGGGKVVFEWSCREGEEEVAKIGRECEGVGVGH